MPNGPASALRLARDLAVAAGFLAVMSVLLAPVVRAEGKNSATVSFLDGKATVSTGGTAKAAPIAKGGTVFENDVVETAVGAKLELRLKDGSAIRIGPSSKLQLKRAYFGDDGEKKFSAKLVFGRVWSKVSGLVGGESKFEVETDNAVAGVRGTTFRVDAKQDRSVLVRVYAGSVAMAPGTAIAQRPATPPGKGKRVQVAGPSQVTLKEWERLVGKMMQMAVNADGTPGDVTAFNEQDDAGDEWAAWNQMMDEKQ